MQGDPAKGAVDEVGDHYSGLVLPVAAPEKRSGLIWADFDVFEFRVYMLKGDRKGRGRPGRPPLLYIPGSDEHGPRF